MTFSHASGSVRWANLLLRGLGLGLATLSHWQAVGVMVIFIKEMTQLNVIFTILSHSHFQKQTGLIKYC